MSPRSTFLCAVWRGIAAPLSIYSSVKEPEIKEVEIKPFYRPERDAVTAIRGDWIRVGESLDAAIKEYAESRSSDV